MPHRLAAASLFPSRHLSLIWQFARRDVLARYRGSLLGLAWSFLNPLLMLAVYTFVFRQVFKARWPGGEGSGLDFAIKVYAGLILFNLFTEILARAPRLVLDQPNLVKKVLFPLEILPWVAVGAGLFHLLTNMVVLVGVTWVAHGALHPTLLAFPAVVAAMIPLLLGISWFLASLGVFLRDVGQLINMLVSALMFLSPIFYPLEALPQQWRPLLAANPLTIPIEQTRLVVLTGEWPDWTLLGGYFLVGCATAWLGALWFALTRKGFADVI